MLRSIGLSSLFERASASSPHGYQSTGLCACCKRYGLDSPARRFVCLCSDIEPPLVYGLLGFNLAADYVPRRAESANVRRAAFCDFRAASDKLNGDSFFFGKTSGACLMERE